MNLNESKQAVRAGKKVHWVNEQYEVIMTEIGRNFTEQWLIKCHSNGSCIGLTWSDGITMNGKEEQFYIGSE